MPSYMPLLVDMQWLTATEAAQFLGVSRQYVYVLIHAGTIPYHKFYGVYYLRRNEIADRVNDPAIVGQRGSYQDVVASRR